MIDAANRTRIPGILLTKPDISELRRTPAYPFVEAAHYLNLPVSTLRAWCLGQRYESVRGDDRWFAALIKLDGERREGLSFLNLVEAHVLAAIRRVHGVPMRRVREALDYVTGHSTVERPFADVTFQTNGVDLFIERLGTLVNVSSGGGQVEIEQFLRAHLSRIERDAGGLPIKLFPFVRLQAQKDAPSPVEIDPRIAFGRPVIRGRAMPTAVLADRFKAGDSIHILARDLDLNAELVEDAIRCELERAAA
jgi:uncharacterized protein (DUF433 family)